MESFIKKLNSLKKSLPGNCTLANLAKLNVCFNQYQQIMESLPATYQPTKARHEASCKLVERTIADTSDPSNSARDTKYYFKLAVQQLSTEIDQQVAVLSEKVYNSM